MAHGKHGKIVGLTLGEAREQMDDLIETYGEDTPLVICYNYGDHCKSKVCEPVTTMVVGNVGYSDYHGMGIIAQMGTPDTKQALIITNENIERYLGEGNEED